MTTNITRASFERTQWTIQAATVLAQQAPAIAQASAEAPDDVLIVTGVKPDLTFDGIWLTPREQLHEHVLSLENAGLWVLTFAPQASSAEIEQHCANIAQLAHKRGEILRRRLGLS